MLAVATIAVFILGGLVADDRPDRLVMVRWYICQGGMETIYLTSSSGLAKID